MTNTFIYRIGDEVIAHPNKNPGDALVSYLRRNDSADKTIEWIGLLKQDYKKFCKEK